MNKYKMIAICSLSIVCILILSLLLPLTTSANDKESLELKMHYENSEVTVNIIVNSEVYTGVICKYIMVDDVLTSDNLLEQTKQTGTAINLDKNETDNYNATIPNVTTRYVVIYVSIGNCNICDYIDCNPNKEGTDLTNNNDTKQVEDNQKNENESIKTDENIANNTDGNNQENVGELENTISETTNTEKNNDEVTSNENVSNESTESGNVNSVDQSIDEQISNDTNVSEQESTEKDEDKIVVNNSQGNSSGEFEIIEDTTPSVEQNNKEQVAEEVETTNQTENTNQGIKVEENSTNVTNQSQNNQEEQTATELETTSSENTNTAIDLQSYDKDYIDVSGFEEIEKTVTTNTADENMPQTGEDDTIKIMGIIIFSLISIVSFYKYQKTK